jgi:hypothetical protein
VVSDIAWLMDRALRLKLVPIVAIIPAIKETT